MSSRCWPPPLVSSATSADGDLLASIVLEQFMFRLLLVRRVVKVASRDPGIEGRQYVDIRRWRGEEASGK